jgi:hypothetical protein
MADELTDEERELLEKHRAERAKNSRKVTVKGTHKESGAEYSFDLEGDEADRVIARHASLFTEDDTSTAKTPPKGKGPYFKGNAKT